MTSGMTKEDIAMVELEFQKWDKDATICCQNKWENQNWIEKWRMKNENEIDADAAAGAAASAAASRETAVKTVVKPVAAA